MSCTLSGTHPSAGAASGIVTIAIAFGIVPLAVMIVVGLQFQCPAQHQSAGRVGTTYTILSVV